MKYLDEYRSHKYVKILVDQIHSICTQPWKIMEVCGGQTHNIVKYGLQQLLPANIQMLHGPGCPVCVTPIKVIDKAIAIANRPDTILCTFGDMLRVPGSDNSLLVAKANGADIRIVYSPLDSIKVAETNLDKEVVFFGVGFETTAPANAIIVDIADKKQLKNFSVLVSNVRVPPVLEVLLSQPDCQVDGFLAAGNVCTVMGEQEYYPIVETFKVPIVITGFEPVDILQGIKACVEQLETGRAELDNQYKRSVRSDGNNYAKDTLSKIYNIAQREWRGLGDIPEGGFLLKEEYAQYDAERKFTSDKQQKKSCSNDCLAGLVLQGKLRPDQCPSFAKQCVPEKPLGAPMVSMEGACNAYYQFHS